MRLCVIARAALRCILVAAILACSTARAAPLPPPPSISKLGYEVFDDSRWLVDSVQLDLEDILTSPLYVAAPQSPFRSRKFYLELGAAGVIWGASFGLDKTIKTGMGDMAHSAHDDMESLSYTLLLTAVIGTGFYGYYVDDPAARRDGLTGTEAAGLAVAINEVVERATGRLRPFQTNSSTAFFAGGKSFTSQDAVIESALATGTSAYYGDKWYVAIPLYSLVLLEGFTLTGNNSQWFSDVIGGGLLGWTTAKALLWLHERQALAPDRWRIFPIAAAAPSPATAQVSSLSSVGLGVSYSW
jgi:membrane-associated phospholipid phosphatase